MAETLSSVNLVTLVEDKNFAEFERCLQQPDCDVSQTDANGLTALMCAVRHVARSNLNEKDTSVYLRIIKLLLCHPRIDVNTRSTGYVGRTALSIACGVSFLKVERRAVSSLTTTDTICEIITTRSARSR